MASSPPPLAIDPQVLFSAIRNLSSARTIEKIASVVTHAAKQAMGCDGITFVLRDGDFCHYFDEQAISPLWKGQRFQARMCISGWAMSHKQGAAIEDIFTDPRIPVDAYRPTFVKSLLMVPVIAEDALAAIGSYWSEKHKATEDEISFMEALADCVSVAMENVRLYNHLTTRLEELQKANCDKDNFLMTLSHELRTPLSAVVGWTHILLTSNMSEKEQHDALKIVERNANLQLKTVEDLLNASGIVMGRFELSKTLQDPIDMVFNALETLRPQAFEKRIALEVERPSRFGQVMADATRMQQALINIIANAIKFTPAGGHVSLSVVREGPSARIKITDNGCGIDPAFLSHIFERFSQEDNSTSRAHGGLGLGLANAKSFIEAHGGTITAKSDGKNKGAEFEIRVPLERIMGTSSSEKAAEKFLFNPEILKHNQPSNSAAI